MFASGKSRSSDCVPPPELLLLGDMRETCRRPASTSRARGARSSTYNRRRQDQADARCRARTINSAAAASERVLVSEPAIAAEELTPSHLPDGIAPDGTIFTGGSAADRHHDRDMIGRFVPTPAVAVNAGFVEGANE